MANPPRLVQLWFSEELASASIVELRDERGNPVAGTTIDLSAARSGKVTLALPRLSRGVYSVDWHVLSEGDLHFSEGGIAFGVGARVLPAFEGDSADSLLGVDVFFRWIGFLCLAGVVGALALATLVFGPLAASMRGRPESWAAERARARALGMAAVCALSAAVVGIGVLLAQTSSLTTAGAPAGKVAWQLLSTSRWGSLWVARELLVLALFGALMLFLRRRQRHTAIWRQRSLALVVIVAMALALVGVQALSGHAFALTPNKAFAVVVAGVHLLAGMVWVGGLLAAVVSLWPLLGTPRRESAVLARACLAPFSVLAAVCVSLLIVTGLYYAGRQVASLDALLTTLYGQALLGKLGLAVAVAALGLLNTLILRPQLAAPLSRLLRRPTSWSPLSTTRLRSLLVAEGLLGVGLLLFVGLLTATPPAHGPAFAQVPASAPSFLSGSADDLLVSLSVKPNRPGENIFEVGAVSTRRPAPAVIERVRLRLTGPGGSTTSPPLREIEPARYRSSGSYLDDSGAWNIEILIDRTGLGESRAHFDWAVPPSGAPRPVLVSRRPLEPILTSAAALVLLSLVIASAWLLIRRLLGDRRVALDPVIRPRLHERAK